VEEDAWKLTEREGAEGQLLNKKRGGPKGGGERATSHQKRTVNRISRGG